MTTQNYTTYDELYSQFLVNCKTDDINLPSSPEKIYDVIHSAIRHYNAQMGTKITYDDSLEQVNMELSDSQILIIAKYIRLAFFENQLIEMTTTWQPYLKELGLRNYQEQSRTLRMLIEREKQDIESYIIANYDGDLM